LLKTITPAYELSLKIRFALAGKDIPEYWHEKLMGE
jgi:hypothetical protein